MLKKERKEDEEKKVTPFLSAFRISRAIICIVLLGIIFFNIKHAIVIVHGESMEPTLKEGNILIAERQPKELNRFDISIIMSNTANKILVKRVIGLPGETIEYKHNKLYINGEEINDPYNFNNTSDFIITLNDNEYCCLGDNRQNSADSRLYGAFNDVEVFAKIKEK